MENKDKPSNFNPELTDNAPVSKPDPTLAGGGMKVIGLDDGDGPTGPALINVGKRKQGKIPVYPEPTRGIHSTNQPPPRPEDKIPDEIHTDKKTKVIILIVRILAILMILFALNSLINDISSRLAFKAALPYGGSALGIIIALVNLAIGVGLLRLSELARATYVFIGSVFFVLTVWGMVDLISILVSSNASIVNPNSSMPSYQGGAVNGGGWTAKLKLIITDARVVWLFIQSLVLQFLPIIFFTRRSVKAVFY